MFKEKSKSMAWLILAAIASIPSMSVPKYERTMLPVPGHLNERDKDLLKEVLKLEVYQDSHDPNQYYYVPPFHVRQYTRGAASMVLHVHNVKQYSTAEKELSLRIGFARDYTNRKIEELTADKKEIEKKLDDAQDKLDEAIALGNQLLITVRKDILERKRDALLKSTERLEHAESIISQGGTLLPAGLGRSYFERALTSLAQAGIDLPYAGGENPDEVLSAIKTSLNRLAASYGGFLSLNAYGGFTKQQLDALVAYKNKYQRDIRVSLMPIEKLTFFSLTEWEQDKNNVAHPNKMFRQINGSGDYLGAAIVMDTSIAGSSALATHLAPFVLPIGIRAVLKQQLLPAEAILTCDFSNGFSVKGRADVRDGLTIYDNDITNTIKAEDVSTGGCNLQHVSGDVTSAEYEALKNMEALYDDMKFRRTQLSREEKDKYYQGALADIQNNGRAEEPHYTKVIRQFAGLSWQTLVIEGITMAADFHWHTNIQDVSNMSHVKFTKRLSVQGHKTIEKELPTNLCLVYNSEHNAYDKCGDAEEEFAKNMQNAMKDARESDVCRDSYDPFECGKNRDFAGYTHDEGKRLAMDDTKLHLNF